MRATDLHRKVAVALGILERSPRARIIINKHSEPVAVLIGHAEYLRLKELADANSRR